MKVRTTQEQYRQKPADVMAEIYRQFWPPTTPDHILNSEIKRHAAQLEMLRSRVAPGGHVVDLGCGWGAFAAGCAALGYRVTMVDDMGDMGFADMRDRRHALPEAYGIAVINRDLISGEWPFSENSLDAVTTYDSMEHWHHSPRKLFSSVVRSLSPGGWLVIGVPNAANLKKRVEAILGMTEWSSMSEWYDKDTFRGHVREPTVRDLRYIASSLGLERVEVLGYNWLGSANQSLVVARITPLFDMALRWRPTLCSDIYLVGAKQGS